MPASTTPTRTCRWRCGRCSSRMPPFWYGSSNTTGAAWSGEHGMHFVANGPTDYAKVNIDAYREALAKRGGAGAAEAGVQGRRRDRRAAPHRGRGDRRGGAQARQAERRLPRRQPQLAAQAARPERGAGAGARAARHDLRGMGEGRHGDRRLARRRCWPRSSARPTSSGSTICSPISSSAISRSSRRMRSLELMRTEVMPKLEKL